VDVTYGRERGLGWQSVKTNLSSTASLQHLMVADIEPQAERQQQGHEFKPQVVEQRVLSGLLPS
jgi:hypothetical protein